MNLICCCCTMAPNTRVTRKWELFAGRNKFYCDGLLMSAPHTGVFYLTCFLITGTSALFFAFDCPYLATRITPAIPIVGAVLYFFTMSSLLRTTFTDPGVIPRASHDEAAYIEKQIEVPNSLNSPTYRPPPRTKEVLVKGQTVKLKYCFTCKIFRPPRASHCSLCDNCVDRFDHHCPWVGNCVGKRNYRFFYMFLVSLAFLAVFIFSCSVTHLVLLMKMEQEVFEVIKKAPFSVIVTFICFFSIWSVIGLAGFHTYLTTSDQTTNEDLKGSFSSKGGQRAINPYSRGNICLNCVHILCGPMTPSLIDRRGIVTDEYILQMQHNPQNVNNQLLTEVNTTPSPLITNQPSLGGGMDPSIVAKHRTFDDNNPGIYRHRSYDNLQNGNSNSLARLVDNEIPLSKRDGPSVGGSNGANGGVNGGGGSVVMLSSNNDVLCQQQTPQKQQHQQQQHQQQQQQHQQHQQQHQHHHHHQLQQISPDDDSLETNLIMNRKRLNNLSGSYNNLFRDNIDTILFYGGNNNDNDNNIDFENDDNLSVTDFKMNEQQQQQPQQYNNKNNNMNNINNNNNKNNNCSSLSSSILLNKSLPTSVTAIAAHSLCHPLKFSHNDFHHSSTINLNLNNGIILNNLRKSASESENVYSNIPNSNISSSSAAVSSNCSNKSDPNLHVYSNLIEEHQNQRKQQQQQHHQQQQYQQQSQRNQLNINNKQLSLSLSKLHDRNMIEDNSILKMKKLKNNTCGGGGGGNGLSVTPVETAVVATVTGIGITTTTTTAIPSSATASIGGGNNIIKDDSDNLIMMNTKQKNFDDISSTLLANDLDLDDPVSAFVVNNRKKNELSSNRKMKNRKSSDSLTAGGITTSVSLSEMKTNATDQLMSPSSSSSLISGTMTTINSSLNQSASITNLGSGSGSGGGGGVAAGVSGSVGSGNNNNSNSNGNNNTNNNNNKERDTVNFITPSRLRLLQDTTMINTALDLDSLDGSSIGNNSQSCLVKTAMV